jgi:hypothetical protein
MKSIFSLYILLWPFLYVLVDATPFSFFKETDFMLFDVRILFYLVFFACLVSRLLNKCDPSTWASVALMGVWLLGYILSFIVNADLDSDYRQFNNGFLLFSIAFASTVAFRKLINWDAVVLAYSIAMILITTIGFLSFFRETGLDLAPSYLRSLFTKTSAQTELSVASTMGSWGEELWRPCGGKTVYIPSAIVLFGLYFRSIEIRRPCVTLNFAVALSALSIAISGQRAAAIALLYLSAMFVWYARARVKIVSLLIAALLLVLLRHEFQTLYDMTFGLKLELVSNAELSRADIWTAATECLMQSVSHFVFGVSEGGLPLAPGSNYPPEFSNNPHSLLLYVWASSGVIGFVAMSVAVVSIGRNVHFESKLYKTVLFWMMLGYFCFAGIGFFNDGRRSDFLNIVLIILIVLIFTNGSGSRRSSVHFDIRT